MTKKTKINKIEKEKIDKEVEKNPFIIREVFQISASNIKTKDLVREYLLNGKVISEKEYWNMLDKSKVEIDLIPKYVLVERTPQTRIFQSPKTRDLISNLSASGKTVFLYIQCFLEKKQNSIKLDKKKIMKWAEIKSIDTVKSGVKDLIANIIIGSTKHDNIYWINPDVIYNGDRLKDFEENVYIVYDQSVG